MWCFVTSCLTTKIRDVHYNHCFEERAGHDGSTNYVLYRLKVTSKISFVETGKNAENSIF